MFLNLNVEINMKSFFKNKLRMIIYGLIILTIIFNLMMIIGKNKEKYLTPYNHEEMAAIYSQSQYIKGPAATKSIGDDGLFAVAGYYLLLQGGDPTQINFESPPAGEYLIGLSILLFRNERVISLIYGLLFLLYTYKLSLLLFKKKIIGLLAVLIISSSSLFHNHLIASQLDLPQGLFVLLGVFYFIKALGSKPVFFFVSSLFFGFAVSTKFFPGIIFFLAVLIIWALRAKIGKQKLILMIVSFLLIPLIYLCSYLMFFYYHRSLWEFIKFHIWVINWRLGNPVMPGNLLLNLLIGRYRSWWDANLWITNHD